MIIVKEFVVEVLRRDSLDNILVVCVCLIFEVLKKEIFICIFLSLLCSFSVEVMFIVLKVMMDDVNLFVVFEVFVLKCV